MHCLFWCRYVGEWRLALILDAWMQIGSTLHPGRRVTWAHIHIHIHIQISTGKLLAHARVRIDIHSDTDIMTNAISEWVCATRRMRDSSVCVHEVLDAMFRNLRQSNIALSRITLKAQAHVEWIPFHLPFVQVTALPLQPITSNVDEQTIMFIAVLTVPEHPG